MARVIQFILLSVLLSLPCDNATGVTLSMDETGYCGEHKQARYIGTGRSISFEIDGINDSEVITNNTRNPKYIGGYEIILVDARPTSDWRYILTYNISIGYVMSLEISGQRLGINATNEDQVSGQTTLLQSCNCSPPIRYQKQNISESEFTLTVSWEHPECCGWNGGLEYTVGLECIDCEPAFNESHSTVYTNTSFLNKPTGMYKTSFSAKNKCGETITEVASFTVDIGKVKRNHAIAESGHTLLIAVFAAMSAVVMSCLT